jgi:hypothetical protein
MDIPPTPDVRVDIRYDRPQSGRPAETLLALE